MKSVYLLNGLISTQTGLSLRRCGRGSIPAAGANPVRPRGLSDERNGCDPPVEGSRAVNRRELLIKASASLTAALAGSALAAEPLKELRIGIIAPWSVLGAALIRRLSGRFALTSFGRSGASASFDLASPRP